MNVLAARAGLERLRWADLVELSKPRITGLIMLTAAVGYRLGAPSGFDIGLLPLLIGTALTSSGAAALNQYLERDIDARMRRTESRPLPAGRVRPLDALTVGLLLSLAGLVLLLLTLPPLAGAVALATSGSYLFAYTPLKVRTSLATIIGAVPGALPPVGGWAAATGRIEPGAVVLFAIVFLWQIPHFLAIAWMHREDYARGGIRMLPVVDPSGTSTARQTALSALALLPVSLVPAAIGMAGNLYLAGALVLGGLMTLASLDFARAPGAERARRLLLASVVYLPLLWILLLVDSTS